MRHIAVLFITISILISGCTTYSYFQSPLHSNNTSYKTIPAHYDSVKSAIYANGAITLGGVNDKLRDGVYCFTSTIHRSNNFSVFQAFYGLSGMLGRYTVDSVHNFDGPNRNESLDEQFINPHVGRKFVATVGSFAGINFVMPLGKGEWRVLGTEISWSKEFGSYVAFRNKIPDTSANYIERKSNYVTIGIYSDVVGKTESGTLGYKLGIVFNPRAMHGFDKYGHRTISNATYLSQTLHFQANQRVTGFGQLNTGSHSLILVAGVNYKLSRPNRF